MLPLLWRVFFGGKRLLVVVFFLLFFIKEGLNLTITKHYIENTMYSRLARTEERNK